MEENGRYTMKSETTSLKLINTWGESDYWWKHRGIQHFWEIRTEEYQFTSTMKLAQFFLVHFWLPYSISLKLVSLLEPMPGGPAVQRPDISNQLHLLKHTKMESVQVRCVAKYQP